MSGGTAISPKDILSPEDYTKVRAAERARIIALKRNRRMDVGPVASAYFENRDTMLYQIHEMLRAEGGGPEQIHEELEAYSPLVPNGRELVATFMIEINDAVRRQKMLAHLGGIEETVFIEVGGASITATAEQDLDRTTADGKASSVHFLHFAFDDAAVEAFRRPRERVVLAVGHPEYKHMAVMPDEVRAALSKDFV